MAISPSCVKETASDSAKTQEVTIRVSIPQEQDTKVSLTTTYNRQKLCLAWKDSDQLSVNGTIFTVSNIISDHEAEFTGEAPEGTEFTIIYPGKYTSESAFNNRSYSSQKQSGNSSTLHLEYNAMLSGVTAYAQPMFDANWAADNGGGTLKQNGAIQLRLQLPEGVGSASSVALIASRPVFPATNAGDVMTDHQILSLDGCALPSNRILEAYMMFSAAGVTWQDNDQLTVAVDTPDAMYFRTLDMSAQTWNGGGEYTVQCKVTARNNFAISSAADLEAFRDGVNSGSFLWQWRHVTLENNIDCSSLGSWTPIGNGTFISDSSLENAYEVSGTPFHGTFDGKGYSLLNLRMDGTPAENTPYGFFGILDGATVKDIVFGASSADEGYFKVTPSGTMEAGIVAGVCRGSTIQNVTNYSPMSILENTSSEAAFFGMVGYVMGTVAGGSALDNVDNYGAVSAHGGSNTNNGGTGFNIAAVAGFSYTSNSNIRNTIENCDNNGTVTTSTGRAAGILSAANARTDIRNCTNHGDIEDSFTNARIGGICALLSNASRMADCSNYGRIMASSNSANAGGLICLSNNDSVEISGGGNHGLVVCNHANKGTIAGNLSLFSSVDGVTAGGAVATYSSGVGRYIFLSEANYMNYIGTIGNSADPSKLTNITYEAWDGYPDGNVTKISNASQLLAFATAVNNGSFGENDIAVLTADIDCSSISSGWVPIGNATSNWVSNKPTVTAGNAFLGTFNGQGHTIRNLVLTDTETTAGKHFGLFGMLGSGAMVQDFIIDESCSLTVTSSVSHSAGMIAGVASEATVRDITSYAPLTYQGGASGYFHMALIGGMYANAADCSVINVTNYGKINAVNTANYNAGATGLHVAGIAGFAHGASKKNIITTCVNYGNMTSQAGRTSGILGAANARTTIQGCTNYGNQLNTMNKTDGTRLGNITCIAGTSSSIIDCINYGNLVSTTSGRVGGIISLANASTYRGNINYGEIISDSSYRGTMFGYLNATVTWEGGKASGKLGTYNNGSYVYDSYDEENQNKYLGKEGSGTHTFTNVEFDILTSGGYGISTAEDLVDFVTAFNSGDDITGFLVDGEVKLNNDINAATITEWIPIGTNDYPLDINFNGNGKTIFNVNWTVDATQAESLGFIGCAQNITVSNLTLGSKDSRITFTGNRSKIRAGGIVGRAQGVTITNVVNNASLEVTGTSATGNDLHLGGIAGYADGASTIGGNADEKGCLNNGNVSAAVAACVGGLAGYNAGAISHSTNKGNISCPSSGNYGPAWLCSHNSAKSKLTSNSGYGLVGGIPAMVRNAVKDNCQSYLDPESVTVDWTLDSYYDWTEVEALNLHSGATYHHYSFTNLPREMYVLEVDLTNPGIELTAALAGDMIPNPNGLEDNDHNYQLNTIRERLSDVCTRRRAEGENILAGINAGFFDTHWGTLRGFHVENGEPLYINNPDCVNSLPNHKWGITVFKDGTASVGVKKFTGKMRAAGKEFDYYSVNDTILRSTHTESAVKYQANLFNSRFKKQPYSDHPELVNTLASDALYVICQWDGDPMTVNTGYARATVTEIRDGRTGSITSPQVSAANKFVIALSGKMAQEWSTFVKVGLNVELNCTITVGGVSKPILTQVSTMYQLMADGRDVSNTPGQNASLYSVFDPMTYPVVSKDGTRVWLIQIDGRQGWYSMGVKGYEMFRIAKKLGGWWATRLDGGGSSCTWVWNGSSGSIVGRPYDTPGGERSCMNYLLVRAKN